MDPEAGVGLDLVSTWCRNVVNLKGEEGWALGAAVSASRLHRVGRGFESLSAHHLWLLHCNPDRWFDPKDRVAKHGG